MCSQRGERICFIDRRAERSLYGGIISPIVAEGDVIGAVVLLMKEETKRTEDGAEKLALAAAAFLGKQMEF